MSELIKKSDWKTIKNLHLTKNVPIDYIEFPKYFHVFAIWNTTKFTTNLFKPKNKETVGISSDNDADYIEFVTYFKPKIDSDPPDSNPVNIAGVGKRGKKLLIHESSRPDSLEKEYTTCWTGSGDDVENHVIWGGPLAILSLEPGMTKTHIDMKFDPLFGEVWIHEGYGMWENAGLGDHFSVYVMAPPAQLQTFANLDLEIVGNRIKPATNGPGTGTHGWANIPPLVKNYNKTGYWDLDENGNLVPKPQQTGNYDVYTVERKVTTFLNKIPIMGTVYNYTMLQSADTARIPYPYFIRIEAFNVSNGSWKIWFFMTLYRERTV